MRGIGDSLSAECRIIMRRKTWCWCGAWRSMLFAATSPSPNVSVRRRKRNASLSDNFC
jgi:hypothetical protein